MPERWRPARAGIRNVWEYDDQVFHFADGRLILRGPNGSGKSNALALLFPFLLDATMAASRMDPFAGGRSMKSLLLCARRDDEGSGFRHDQRTGYVWLELSRTDDDGTTEHLVLGAGARATVQRDATAWFFLTARRPGFDLELAPDGTCLTHQRLVEELGRDAVFDTADAYRTAVGRDVLGVGPDRYRNLVELVLVLRRPQLAGKLNLEQLSKVLSDGLPTLDTDLVADVAASFEDLEHVQADLRKMRSAKDVVDRFVPVHRRYVRTVAAARAGDVLAAGREARSARNRVTATAERVTALEREADAARATREETRAAIDDAASRQRAHLESPAYRDAKSLIDISERASEARSRAENDERLVREATDDVGRARIELAASAEEVEGAEVAVDRAFDATARAADDAGIAWTERRDDVAVDGLGATLRAAGVERREDVRVVGEALAAARRADDAAGQAEDAAGRSLEQADRAETERHDAEAAVDAARVALGEAVAGWASTTALVDQGDLEALVGAVADLGRTRLADVLSDRWQPRRDELTAAVTRALDTAAALRDERADVERRRSEVAAERDDGPHVPPWRPADRTGRSGAPLYACCDFASSVAVGDRAGLEAALEASGLLDAWIGPSDDLDAWLRPSSPAPEPTLATVLVPAPPDGVDPADVATVLASVSLTEAGVMVTPDGRFRLGPLTGRFAKDEPGFVGATARAERRRRRLAELDEELVRLDEALADVEDERAAAVAEQLARTATIDDLPPEDGVLDALRHADTAAIAARLARERAEVDAARGDEARRAAAGARKAAGDVAGQRRLPDDAERLDAAAAAVTAYLDEAQLLEGALRRVVHLGAAHQSLTERAQVLESRLAERTTAHAETARHAAVLEARVDELRQALGGDPEAPLRRLEEIEQDLERLATRQAALGDEIEVLAGRIGSAKEEHRGAEGAVERAEARGREAAQHLDVLRRAEVWEAVSDDLEAPPADPLVTARRIADATAGVATDPDAREQAHRDHSAAFKHLLDELRFGFDPSSTPVDDLDVVAVTSESGTFSTLRLAGVLAEQVERQEQYLSERDREVFERHLLTRVSEALRDLLNDASAFVDEVNACLRETPTASGLRVELRWEVDTADAGTKEAVALLRRSPELLGPDDRERLRRFFASAIAAQRADDPGAGYAAVLSTVLDYRRWHVFRPQLGQVGSGVKPLTRTVFRSLSGGEQAVALHLPLFAAAAAHYRAANPSAPRLVALDEAFAGIDEAMRGELMGLLVRFDLDVILTGHELWGAYEEVPAVAVYDLLRRPPAEGVSALALRWEGGRMHDDAELPV